MTHIIDGKAIASRKRQAIKQEIEAQGLSPALAIILANDLDASAIYIRNKMKACDEVGIQPHLHQLDMHTSQDDIITLIHQLNNDPTIHGIFLQLPVGNHLDSKKIIQAIAPEKDVDGLTYINLGRVMSDDQDGLVPCTPQGVMALLSHDNIPLSGKHAVIIGRSILFGKPMGQLLLNANCTVTQCHSKTNKITGDVDFDNVKSKSSQITPVPGGVGPMTIACLLANTLKACQSQS